MEPIENYNLSTKICEAIKKSIIKNELEPNQKITEAQLAQMLGVSKTPIREALRILDGEGYITLRRNSSFVIKEFTLKDALEVLQVRGALEGEAAYIASKVRTEADIEKLKEIHSGIGRVSLLGEDERYTEFVRVDTLFHMEIIKIAGNSRILQLSNSLHDRLYRARTAFVTQKDAISICEKQHKGILDAIIAGDGDLAEARSKSHTRYIADQIVPCVE